MFQINDGNTFCYIPEKGANKLQFGATEPVERWELLDPIPGVTLDENGLLTVESTTDVSGYANREHWVTVIAHSKGRTDKLPVVICHKPDWSKVPPPMPVEDEIAALKTRVEAIESKVTSLEAARK